MNYEDMSDFEINKLVAGIVTDGDVIDYCDMFKGPTDDCVQVIYKIGIHGEHYDYCNNPSDAWPIIAENNISMLADSDYALDRHLQKFKLNFTGRYVTSAFPAMSDGFNGDEVQSIDKNPLRSAMICFLKMKDAESE